MADHDPVPAPPRLSEEDIAGIVSQVDGEIAAHSSKFLPILSPLLEGNVEGLKNLISISGGALVATISVIQFMAEKIDDPKAVWLLPVSWTLFVVTIIFSVFLQGVVTQWRSLHLQLMNARIEALGDWAKTDQTSSVDLVNTIHARMTKKVNSINKMHTVSTYFASFSFLGAMITLVLFAILNLPF